MSTKPIEPRPNTAAPAAAPASKQSPLRLAILLGILLLAIAALAYDYYVAKPAVEETNNRLHALVDARNAEKITLTGGKSVVTSADVQKEIGSAPTFTREEKDYTAEYYCWWGHVPFLNTYRQYIVVTYVGEPRRYNSHHPNSPPPDEFLPGYLERQRQVQPPESEDNPLGPIQMTEPTVAPPLDESAADSGDKAGKSEDGEKGKSEDSDAKADDAPAAKSDVEPADKAEATDEPKSDGNADKAEKPASTEPDVAEPAPPAPETAPPAEDAEGKADEPKDE